MQHDLVIRGGRVVDGGGGASGLVVTPGFVDSHTHLDGSIFWDPIASSTCWHGVTSVGCRRSRPSSCAVR